MLQFFHSFEVLVQGEFLILVKVVEAPPEFECGGDALENGSKPLDGSERRIVESSLGVSAPVLVRQGFCASIRKALAA